MRVRVYRNLKHGKKKKPLYSVLYKGRVIKRVRRILLSGVSFIVREAGRQRVLKEKCKNVHAFIEGDWVQRGGAMGIDANSEKDLPIRVKYNPYKFDSFVIDAPGLGYHEKKICTASAVLINSRGATAAYVD